MLFVPRHSSNGWHGRAWMQMLPFTKIHLVELAIEIFSTNQEITTAAVSSRLRMDFALAKESGSLTRKSLNFRSFTVLLQKIFKSCRSFGISKSELNETYFWGQLVHHNYPTMLPMPSFSVSIYWSWKVWFASTFVLLGETENKGTPGEAVSGFISFVASCFWLSGILALCSWRFRLILLRRHMLWGHAMQASCFVAEGYMMQRHVVYWTSCNSKDLR